MSQRLSHTCLFTLRTASSHNMARGVAAKQETAFLRFLCCHLMHLFQSYLKLVWTVDMSPKRLKIHQPFCLPGSWQRLMYEMLLSQQIPFGRLFCGLSR